MNKNTVKRTATNRKTEELLDELIDQIVNTKDWRYRLVRRLDEDGNPALSLHLVYYDSGSPIAYCREPASPFGSTLQGLTEHANRINEAFKHRPVNSIRIPGA